MFRKWFKRKTSKSNINNFHTVLGELLSSDYDNKSTRSENYAIQLVRVHEEFARRNEKLTTLLSDFIDQRRSRVKTNNVFKIIIFVFLILMLTVLTGALVMFVEHNIGVSTLPALGSLLSVLITYLVSLIAVLEIMTRYLFPLDEEKDTINMIKAVISNDVKVEDLMSKAIDKSNQDDIKRLQAYKELLNSQTITNEEFCELKAQLLKKFNGGN